MAFTEVYVDPDAEGNNDGSSWANAYTTLQAAESANDVDITGGNSVRFNCKSSGGSADTVTTFVGWTTDADSYILVQGGYAAGETGTPGTPEYPTEYSTSYYHIEAANGEFGLYFREDYCYADKILVQGTEAGGATGCIAQNLTTATNNFTKISNCICKGVCSSTGSNRGIYITDSDTIAVIENCICYGFVSGENVDFYGFQIINCATCNIYNSLAYGNYYGFRRTAGTVTVYNCVSFGNTDDFNGDFTFHKCASDDNDGNGENVAGNEADATWSTDFKDAAGGDFELLSGSPLIGAGDTGLSYGGTSINGVERGAAWDIGPWEYVAAGGETHYVPILLQQYRRRWSEL